MTNTAKRLSGSEKRQRKHGVHVRLTAEEFAEVAAQAEATLLTPASYIRMAVLDAPPERQRRRPSVEAEQVSRVLAQLGKIGNNLNQIAHGMNAGRGHDAVYLAQALADLSAMRDACMAALGRKT